VALIAPAGPVSAGNIRTGDSYYASAISLVGSSVTAGNLTSGAAPNSGASVIGVSALNGGISVGNVQTGSSSFSFVDFFATGDIVAGAITTRSSNPLFSGGSVFLGTETGRILVNGNIDTRGADGNSSFPSGSPGGELDIVRPLTAAAPASANSVEINGSILTGGGNGATSSIGQGGNGGSGGAVFVGADGGEAFPIEPLNGSIKVAGQIITKAGNGGVTTNPAYGGGWGGSGGLVNLAATSSISVGPAPKFQVFPTAMDTSGGAGGASTAGTAGGQGGMAGAIYFDPTTITVSGTILGLGGAGGSGSIGGNGGAGAILNFQTPNGVVTFLNGGFDVTGGLGGSPGGLAGLTTAPVINGTLV